MIKQYILTEEEYSMIQGMSKRIEQLEKENYWLRASNAEHNDTDKELNDIIARYKNNENEAKAIIKGLENALSELSRHCDYHTILSNEKFEHEVRLIDLLLRKDEAQRAEESEEQFYLVSKEGHIWDIAYGTAEEHTKNGFQVRPI